MDEDNITPTNYELKRDNVPGLNVHEITISFTVPEIPYKAGGYMLTFYNQRLSAADQSAAFTFWLNIEPGIKLSSISITPGTQVTITGNGFTADEDINLTFDGKQIDETLTSNNMGSFSTTFTVPVDTIAGQHKILASEPSRYNMEDEVNLKVVPYITMEPELPDVGTEATITGRGFAATSEITIEYDGTAVGNSPTTDDNGSFTYTFKVPKGSESEHSVIATDRAGNKASLGGLKLEGEAPPAPTPIRPMSQRFGMFGSQMVSFAWNEVNDPSGITYTLEICDNLNFFPLAPGMRKTNLTSNSTVLKLDPGTYYWRVRATDGAGNESPWTLSPYPFKVGLFSIAYLIIGIVLLILIIVFIVRAAFRRIHTYYE